MADEHVPASSPQPPTGLPAPPPRTATDFTNGMFPPSAAANNGEAPARPSVPGGTPEWLMLARWMLGLLLVAVCGWGLLGLIFYLTRSLQTGREVILGVAAALDLGLFLFLERNFRLTRFMGLRIEPNSHAWHSAVLLWLLGVLGLLFRSTDFHGQAEAEAATRTAARPRPRPQPVQRGDSVREIVETIVFVVVLVLLLKSFAAEAFVIPTGSMAQTLLGYQKEVVCPDCGTKFPINCSQEVDPSEGGKPSPVYACVCPNCLQHIHFRGSIPQREMERYIHDNPTSMEIEDPGWNSGDRVLVAKFVYDLLHKAPDRLDVVVFKYPGDDHFPTTGPHKNHVPMNYIKRLIGLPGETIAIRGGKLYFLSPDKGLHYGDYEKARGDPEMMATLWQKDHMHVNDAEARDRFDKGQFQIIRKSPENILAMMRLVYDNDHPAKRSKLPERWASPDGAWKPQAPHGFRFDGDSGQEHWLRYRHLLRDNGGKPALITDIMGYNTYQGGMHLPLLGSNWVGDLILECEAVIDDPQGKLTLELSKGADRFRARFDPATGTCALLRVSDGGAEQELDSKPTALRKRGTYRLRFANVDERLVVWVNGELPFDGGVTYAPAGQLGPQKDNDLEPAGVGVKGGGIAVSRLKLFRDTYYTVGGAGFDRPNEPDVSGVEPTRPETWDGLRNPPLLTLYVQPDHFLCLGDNSPESSDGRSWGAVPQRLLLGRALLVYYPFSRAGRIR